ncbi:hypothetical protein MMC25_004925 [Agyrium rufum]|nr:hypothetical protein [Agyrium rufum]
MAPPLMGGYQFMYDAAAKSLAKMPEFIAQTGFKNPTGPTSPFQYALNTDLPVWPWLNQNPALLNHFNSFMMGQRMHRTDWFEFCPVEDLLFNSFKGGDNPLLIDIAGGRGHCLEALKNCFPDAPGQLILQELPETLNDITDLRHDIIKMPYNFFTPQPVQGARGYYFRSIFHDWSDDKAGEILRHTAAAMTRGYSRLLIFECVLPDVGVPLYPALLDINMMTLFSGMERTETQWKELLDSAGLKVVKFWGIGKDTEGLIEAVLKD